MAVKRNRGLGMGLEALFGETEGSYENAKRGEESVPQAAPTGDFELEMSQIVANPNQPRKNFDQNALQELADSIKLHGVIQPIVVNKHGRDRYMIIAGERRFRAATLAGLEKIPAVVKDYDSQKIKEVSIIENLQREDLNAVEAARAIRQLMEEFRFTQEQVAERLGKSRPAIANTLRLLSLTNFVLDLVEGGKLSAGHARTLVVVEDSGLQMELAKQAVQSDISVRDFEKLVKVALTVPAPKEEKVVPELSVELRDMVDRMQKTFATRVQVMGNDKKGRIYIDYFSRDDLDRISDLLNKLS